MKITKTVETMLLDLGHSANQIKQLGQLLSTARHPECCGGCGSTMPRPSLDARNNVYAIECLGCGNPDVSKY